MSVENRYLVKCDVCKAQLGDLVSVFPSQDRNTLFKCAGFVFQIHREIASRMDFCLACASKLFAQVAVQTAQGPTKKEGRA